MVRALAQPGPPLNLSTIALAWKVMENPADTHMARSLATSVLYVHGDSEVEHDDRIVA